MKTASEFKSVTRSEPCWHYACVWERCSHDHRVVIISKSKRAPRCDLSLWTNMTEAGGTFSVGVLVVKVKRGHHLSRTNTRRISTPQRLYILITLQSILLILITSRFTVSLGSVACCTYCNGCWCSFYKASEHMPPIRSSKASTAQQASWCTGWVHSTEAYWKHSSGSLIMHGGQISNY